MIELARTALIAGAFLALAWAITHRPAPAECGSVIYRTPTELVEL